MGSAANLPICGPLLIFVPRSEALGTPGGQGLCRQSVQLWANVDFVLRSKALGTPETAGVM